MQCDVNVKPAFSLDSVPCVRLIVCNDDNKKSKQKAVPCQ